MKRIISILLAMMMLLSLAACGDNTTTDPDKDNPGVSQSGNEGTTNSGVSGVLHELFDIQQLEGNTAIPDFAKKAIGSLSWCDDLGADSFGKYNYNIYMKEVTRDDFDTYVANLKANAPTNTTEGENFGFYWNWGQITGTYFPDSGTLDVVLTAQGDNQDGEENNSGTTEPDNTSNNSAGNNEGDTWTVENFLKLYGFNAEDIKPNHFTSFEELKMADSKEPGKKGSMGSVTINVEKGKTTADDFNAWFESLYTKMTALSDDGKLWYSVAKTVEAPSLSELQSGALWADMPGGLCVITTKVDGSAMTISISSKYDVELEQYSISITVMSVA